MHVEQPPTSLHAIKKRLRRIRPVEPRRAPCHDRAFRLGAACALAVALGRLTPEEAWEAAHVDEDWQIAQWGEDEEAKQRRANRHRDFAAAARMLTLLK